MNKKRNPALKIDREFKYLIRPLSRNEYLQLEENILADGCREPIITWKGYIVDGHNRYEICRKHNIPFKVLEKEFDCKESAIIWICANQLGRRNIAEETRRYLIGKQYEAEKVVNSARNPGENNQYSSKEGSGEKTQMLYSFNRHQVVARIAAENNISYVSVQRYARYARALEAVAKKSPDLVMKILSGRCKISLNNIFKLAYLPDAELKRIVRLIEQEKQPFIQYSTTRKQMQQPVHITRTLQTGGPSVKDMPAFDPDAEVAGLTLTIPSWISSIDRTRMNLNPTVISEPAKDRIIGALSNLRDQVDLMLAAIKET